MGSAPSLPKDNKESASGSVTNTRRRRSDVTCAQGAKGGISPARQLRPSGPLPRPAPLSDSAAVVEPLPLSSPALNLAKANLFQKRKGKINARETEEGEQQKYQEGRQPLGQPRGDALRAANAQSAGPRAQHEHSGDKGRRSEDRKKVKQDYLPVRPAQVHVLESIDEFSLSFYKVEKKIAKGSFGTVYRVRRLVDGQVFAAKLTKTKKKALVTDYDLMQGIPSLEELRKEADLHSSLLHKNIVKVEEVFFCNSRTMEGLLTVMEYADRGSLRHYLQWLGSERLAEQASESDPGEFQERMHSANPRERSRIEKERHSRLFRVKEFEAKWIIKQLLEAIHYLHQYRGLAHRDLKPENILLSTNLPGQKSTKMATSPPSSPSSPLQVPSFPSERMQGSEKVPAILSEEDTRSAASKVPSWAAHSGCSKGCLVCNGVKVLLADFGFSVAHTDPMVSFCGSMAYIAPEIVLRKAPTTNGRILPPITPKSASAAGAGAPPASAWDVIEAPNTSRLIEGEKVDRSELRSEAPRQHRSQYDEKCDIWSIGVICFELLYGFTPFSGAGADTAKMRVASHKAIVPIEGVASEAAEDFVLSLLQKDPRHRLSVDECLDHPWIQGVKPKTRAGR